MKLWDIFEYVLQNLMHRKLRSWLTILGIVIGIAAIVSLISISQGLSNSINSRFEAFGSDMIIVVPMDIEGRGMSQAMQTTYAMTYFEKSDVEAIKRLSGVRHAGGMNSLEYSTSPTVFYRGENTTIGVVGIDYVTEMELGIDLEEGRKFGPNERGVAVLGNKVAKDTFKHEIGAGQYIYINGKKTKVTGILPTVSGNIFLDDTSIYVPIDDIPEISDKVDEDEVPAIIVFATKNADIAKLEASIKKLMDKRRRVNEDTRNYGVVSSEYINQQIGQIMNLLTIFLGGIATISLIVGGIGVLNTMFMSVMERTREIGIMKAIGASEGKILQVFLFEAGMIGLIGGIAGVVLGTLVAVAITFFGLKTAVSWELVAFALGFSFCIGLIAGYFPAKNAAEMQPVDALRYE